MKLNKSQKGKQISEKAKQNDRESFWIIENDQVQKFRRNASQVK